MSEFTSGNILLVSDKDLIRNYVTSGSIIYPLDNKWFALLTEDDNYMEYEEAPDYIYSISNVTPVFYFYKFEDHFWGYRLFHEGKEIADLHISYEFAEEIVNEVAKERFPDSKFSHLLFSGEIDKVRIELEQNNVIEEQLKLLFSNCNIEAFKLFGLTDEQVNDLKRILNIDYIELDIVQGMSLVEEFKSIVGIEEMSFIRYERVLESKEYEELF